MQADYLPGPNWHVSCGVPHVGPTWSHLPPTNSAGSAPCIRRPWSHRGWLSILHRQEPAPGRHAAPLGQLRRQLGRVAQELCRHAHHALQHLCGVCAGHRRAGRFSGLGFHPATLPAPVVSPVLLLPTVLQVLDISNMYACHAWGPKGGVLLQCSRSYSWATYT